MLLFTAEGMRAADRGAADAGVPTYTLMEAAGAAVAEALRRRWPEARRVALLCGPGNNGGDGFVAARLLAAANLDVRVHVLAPPRGGSDAERAWHALAGATHDTDGSPAASAARLVVADDAEPPPGAPGARVPAPDVLVDALFGSGLSRPLEGRGAAWAEAANASGVPILAVDVPSGVRADRAGIVGAVVRAAATVQLAGACVAGTLAPARTAFGASEVVDIGIPPEVLRRHAAGRVLGAADAAPHLGSRPEASHKYTAGTVLVVGGSAPYAGAAELAARGAYRAGAGLVTVATGARAPGGWVEVVWERLDDGADAADAIRAVGVRRAGATVLGPGWQVDPAAARRALLACPGEVVLDAGALLPELADAARARGGVVLTPHHGEAARLLRALTREDRAAPGDARDDASDDSRDDARVDVDVDDDPVAAARALAEAYGGVAVVKGAGTVLADRDGRLAISPAGSPAMATGGTGDVLAGVLAAILAPGAADDGERFSRACAAVLLHGRAGERAAAALGDGMIASDVVDALPATRRALLDEAGGPSGPPRTAC